MSDKTRWSVWREELRRAYEVRPRSSLGTANDTGDEPCKKDVKDRTKREREGSILIYR